MAAPKRPTPRRGGPPSPVRAVLTLGAVVLALLIPALWWIGSSSWTAPLTGRSSALRPSKPDYVGERSCRDCHPGESAAFSRSGHARTLRPAAATPLARKLDGRVVADPERPDVHWSYALRSGRLAVTRSPARGEVEQFIIDYAFGSDHHATTFVSLTGANRLPATEHRLTHFSDGDTLKVTPGQSVEKPFPGLTPHGRVLPDWEALACFRCHVTRVSAEKGNALDPATMIPNVSCERCHGPASLHLAAARAGGTELTMPFGAGRWTAESQMALCGKCHRHPSEALPGRIKPEIPALARFQPIGIMQSKCYQSSEGAFSCVNCHDPHARASSDRITYEAACLRCHGADRQVPCPVSPRSGCIECHMPRVDTGQIVPFTDHWIRVRKSTDPPAVRPARADGKTRAHP